MTFKKPDEMVMADDRLIVSVWGDPKVGKTQFALTFPRPLFLFDWDHGLEHHLHRVLGQDVYISEYNYGSALEPKPEDYIRLQSEFDADYMAALATIRRHGSGSIVLDSGTAYWDMVQNAFAAHNTRSSKQRFDYGPPNAYVNQTFALAKLTPGCNLCVIHRAKEKYTATGQSMNQFVQHGNKAVEYYVQAQIHLQFVGDRHFGTLESSWDAPDLKGIELDELTYDSLKATLLPFRKASDLG